MITKPEDCSSGRTTLKIAKQSQTVYSKALATVKIKTSFDLYSCPSSDVALFFSVLEKTAVADFEVVDISKITRKSVCTDGSFFVLLLLCIIMVNMAELARRSHQ